MRRFVEITIIFLGSANRAQRQSRLVRGAGHRRSCDRPRAAQAEVSGSPCLGAGTAHPGQPDLRLLEGPLGALARALDRLGRAELNEPVSAPSQKPGPAIAMGAAGAAGIPRRGESIAWRVCSSTRNVGVGGEAELDP
jgi:hypothetical protein